MNHRSLRVAALLLMATLSFPWTQARAAGASGSPGIHDLLIAGYVDKTIQAARVQLSQSPDDAETHYLLGRAYLSVKDLDKAVSELERAAALQPESSRYQLWLGRAYGEKASDASFLSAMSWARKTRQAFERAVQLDPNSVEARSDLTEFYLEAPGFLGGGTEKAKDQIEKIAARDQARAHTFRARLAEKEKNYSLAEEEFRKAVTASGNQASYWLDLASFYRRRSRWDDMEKTIQIAVDSAAGKPAVLFEAAEILHRARRNLPGAAELLRRYLSSNNKDEAAPAFRAHYLLGAILEQQKLYPEAAVQYRAALEMAQEFRPAREALKKIQN